ncbi:MAG: hypothetical protein HYW34_01870 [Candidatus Brennerbacteria bacterium]|nr:hypothetical protein [Candidatus Brennerbacteria bacterium]
MKKILLLTTIILLALSFRFSYASYDLGTEVSLKQNYLEDKKLGTSSVFSSTISAWEQNQPTIAVRYSIADNSSRSAAFLPLIKKQFDFGAGLKLNENYMLKLASTQLTEDSQKKNEAKDFNAYGIYLNRYGSFFKKTEIGAEYDNTGKTLYYGYSRINLSEKTAVLAGFSTENSEKDTEQRFGLAIAPNLKSYSLIFGLTRNLTINDNAKLYGLAYFGAENTGFPSFITVFRDKPESKYFLGIAAFGGKALNQRSYQGIYDVMFAGTLSGTRVVANRNFNQIGVSNLYKTQDYGKLVITTSIGDIKITDATSLFFDSEEITYSFNGNKPVQLWFLSFGHNGETNLSFNPISKSLKEDYQETLVFGIGVKFSEQKQIFDVNLRNSYSLNQSEWSGVSAMLNFYF